MNRKQLLRDADIEPTSEAIAEGLGSVNNIYISFLENLKNYDIEVDWRYYNDGKAWLGKGLHKWVTARGAHKEVTAFWLSIWEGFFRVTIFLPEKYRAEALNLSLSGEIRKMIEEAKQMGKLKFFPLIFDLCSDEMSDEVFTIIDFRKTLK